MIAARAESVSQKLLQDQHARSVELALTGQRILLVVYGVGREVDYLAELHTRTQVVVN
jgi:hypothetical protein